MTEHQTIPVDTIPAPASGTTAAETINSPSNVRKWLSGAALVAAGLVAGSGATYAATVHSTDTQTQGTQTGQRGGPGGRGGFADGGPGGALPSGAPSTQTG